MLKILMLAYLNRIELYLTKKYYEIFKVLKTSS